MSALQGIKVLELGQLIAGPFAGTLLGYFGAEVVKVESPQGDPIRSWRTMQGDTSLWWRTISRNKRLLSLDLRTEAGRQIVRELAAQADVLIENFRPGRMEQWGLGPDALAEINPRLVVCRVSGYGQTGPMRQRPGYAAVAEAVGGLRYLTGDPDGPSKRANLSIGDTVAGMHAAIGILLALLHRERGGPAQVVDVSLVESVLTLLEATLVEASVGVVRQPSGGTITGLAPTGGYPCADGEVVIGANGESVFRRLCAAMGKPQLGDDPRFVDNPARVAHRWELDAEIAAWTRTLSVSDCVDQLAAAGVPAGPVQDAAQILAHPQLVARDFFPEIHVGGQPIVLPELAPRMEKTPGATRFVGGPLGADSAAVLCDWLGIGEDRLAELVGAGVVGSHPKKLDRTGPSQN
ncbi:MAG: CoA transferase [Myxococcota bacterium]|nr:CoA transferase [Myxococcota bacterium]